MHSGGTALSWLWLHQSLYVQKVIFPAWQSIWFSTDKHFPHPRWLQSVQHVWPQHRVTNLWFTSPESMKVYCLLVYGPFKIAAPAYKVCFWIGNCKIYFVECQTECLTEEICSFCLILKDCMDIDGLPWAWRAEVLHSRTANVTLEIAFASSLSTYIVYNIGSNCIYALLI